MISISVSTSQLQTSKVQLLINSWNCSRLLERKVQRSYELLFTLPSSVSCSRKMFCKLGLWFSHKSYRNLRMILELSIDLRTVSSLVVQAAGFSLSSKSVVISSSSRSLLDSTHLFSSLFSKFVFTSREFNSSILLSSYINLFLTSFLLD